MKTKLSSFLLLSVILLSFVSCSFFDMDHSFPVYDGNLSVTFIDVGQGDSSFIEFPDGETMLIDSGEQEYSSRVIKYIKSRGFSKIDYLLVTHPHSDHMGGMADIINAFDIGKIYMTNASTTTSVFDNLLNAISSENLKITRAKCGVSVKTTDNLSVSLLSPVKDEYDDLNNYSSVCKIIYGSTSFLFMGDAEKLAENELTGDISCNVVKIGHHGSSSSSGIDFATKTNADFGILSVGEGNSYGHPNTATVSTWESLGTVLLRTDKCGNIFFSSNGENLTYETQITQNLNTTTPKETTTSPSPTFSELPAASYDWMLNTSSKKIHTTTCSSLKSIKAENLSHSDATLDFLQSEGYSLCKICKPTEE